MPLFGHQLETICVNKRVFTHYVHLWELIDQDIFHESQTEIYVFMGGVTWLSGPPAMLSVDCFVRAKQYQRSIETTSGSVAPH